MKVKLLQNISTLMFVLFLFNQAWASEQYTDNQDGTITDNEKGVMWQKQDDGVERVWVDSAGYCDSLDLAGYSDWELPKIHLLEGLIDTGNSPTINPLFQVKPSYYWSSSVSHTISNSAKYVNFYYGNTYAYSKDNTYYTLCVRHISNGKDMELRVDFISEVTDTKPPFTVGFKPEITGGSEPYFFEWDFDDGDTSSQSSPVHKFLAPGNYNVVLTVSDNDGAIADAGSDQTVEVDDTVTLDGSDSEDPNGDSLTYAWSQTSGPTVTLSSTTAQKPTFTPTETGTYVFSLEVDDGEFTDSDSVTITVTPGSLRVKDVDVTVDGKKVIELKFPDATLSYSVLLTEEDDHHNAILLDRRLAQSMLMRLFLFKGEGMKYFKLFAYDADLTKRTEVAVFEIDWERFEKDLNRK